MNFCYFEKDVLVLENEHLRRSFKIGLDGRFRTIELVDQKSGSNLISQPGPEFELSANGDVLTADSFRYVGYRTAGDVGRKELIVELEAKGLCVSLHYEIYADHPLVRKWLTVTNRERKRTVLTDFAWEKLNLRVSEGREEEVWSYYFTRRGRMAVVNMDDCAIVVDDPKLRRGFILASEAPGCMKRFEIYWKGDAVSVMFNNNEETIFERILDPGETFKSPESFILVYSDMKWQDVVDGPYRCFVEGHLTQMDPNALPSVIVNNWHPFLGKINREILLEQIDLAAEMGVDMYQCDFGWSTFFGEWSDDLERFPNGFGEIVERILSHGMKVGLWISLPAVDRESPVAKQHPEWLIRDKDGNPWHMKGWDRTYSMCLASDFKYYITDKIDEVIKKYHVSLMKTDLSSVRNLYIPGEHAGCYAEGHHHRTHNASHLMIYEAMFEIFQELKRRNPNCIMDLSFELYNVVDGTDLALTKFADTNWFTNQDSGMDTGVRRALCTRGRVVAPYTLNFGGCSLDHPTARDYGMFSVLTSHALFYGDLSKLSAEDREYYRKWFAWIKRQRAEDDFYRYYKVSDVFPVPDAADPQDRRDPRVQLGELAGPPTERQLHEQREGRIWDGVAKVNDEGNGPIIFLRPGNCQVETQRFRIPWVLSGRRYRVWDQNEERLVGEFEGKVLQEAGIEVTIPKQPGAKVLVFSSIAK